MLASSECRGLVNALNHRWCENSLMINSSCFQAYARCPEIEACARHQFCILQLPRTKKSMAFFISEFSMSFSITLKERKKASTCICGSHVGHIWIAQWAKWQYKWLSSTFIPAAGYIILPFMIYWCYFNYVASYIHTWLIILFLNYKDS